MRKTGLYRSPLVCLVTIMVICRLHLWPFWTALINLTSHQDDRLIYKPVRSKEATGKNKSLFQWGHEHMPYQGRTEDGHRKQDGPGSGCDR